MRRVVITGLGPVTPAGVGADAFREGWQRHTSAIGPITAFDPKRLPVRIAGEVDIEPEEWVERRQLAWMDRFAVLATAGVSLALEHSRLLDDDVDRSRVGAMVGTGAGGLHTWEQAARVLAESGAHKLGPRFIPSSISNNAAAMTSMRYNFTGPNSAPVSACSSGADAMVAAAQSIQLGEADVMIAGGAEAPVTAAAIGGFSRMRALSTRNEHPASASRPFHRDRDGFVIAEGAGVLVLEERQHALSRGAVVLAELLGYGRSADAHHLTMPAMDGRGPAMAMSRALKAADLEASQVSYVNAHGTGTPYNDMAETAAIRGVFGDRAEQVPVSSLKAITGHMIGAAGSAEAIACVQALETGVVPGTANLDDPDPRLGLDFVPEGPRRVEPDVVLSNSNAFGGHNVCLALGRPR